MVLRTRLELHDILKKLPSVEHVYYTPPTDVSMNYPCLLYNLSSMLVRHADNVPYLGAKRYSLTWIDEDPDTVVPSYILDLPYCSFDRSYVADGLYHFVFTLFF